MAKLAFTEFSVRAIKSPTDGQCDYWDQSFKHGLFGCRVSQGGSKTFLIKHRNRRITIGKYPTISLSDARTEAKRLLAEFTLGKVRPQTISYEQAVKQFLEDKERSRTKSTTDSYKGLLNRMKFAGPLAEITHQEVTRKLTKVPTEGAFNHYLVALKVFFNWCIKRRFITENPCMGIAKFKRPKRKKTLTGPELKKIWDACSDLENDLPAIYRSIVKLLIACGQRRGEVAGMRPSFFKDDVCTLPETLTKNHLEHAFPVGQHAMQILKPVLPRAGTNHDDLLFPARGHLDNPFSGWSKSKEILDTASSVTGYTLHDLRRTFRTGLGQLGVAPHIAERCVNHISSQTEMEQTYDQYRYLPEMRDAMKKWDGYLTKVLA